jgi:integrase
VRTSKGLVTKKTKNVTSKRSIYVGEKIINFLKQLKEKQEPNTEYVAHYYSANSYSEHFRNLLKNNNLKHIRFHDLRHFNATMQLKLGVPTKVVADRLGHSTVQTTQEIYQHVLKDMNKSAANKLDSLF